MARSSILRSQLLPHALRNNKLCPALPFNLSSNSFTSSETLLPLAPTPPFSPSVPFKPFSSGSSMFSKSTSATSFHFSKLPFLLFRPLSSSSGGYGASEVSFVSYNRVLSVQKTMLKYVLGKVLNKGVNLYGRDKVRPPLYVLTSGFHNGQVHFAPRSFFGVEDFLDDDNSRPYTYQKEKKSKNPGKHVSFKQRTVAYMEPFTLDVFISKRFVSASLTHRVTSKQVAVAGTNSKDIKAALKSRSDIPACLAVGRILSERAREADVYTASYTPRDRDKFEGKIRAVVQSLIDNGIDVKIYLD